MYTIYNGINAFIYLMSARSTHIYRDILMILVKLRLFYLGGKCNNLKAKYSFVRDT